jgi:AP-1 complex subunit gamma-1
MIAADTSLQSCAVHALFRALEEDKGRGKVSCIAAWCVGEYGELLATNCPAEDSSHLTAVPLERVTGLLISIMECSLASTNVKQYLLTAMIKLCSRYPRSQEALRACMARHAGSLVVEIQQRALEYSALSHLDSNLLKTLTDHMPTPEDEAVVNGGGGGGEGGGYLLGGGGGGGGKGPAPNDDLLGLLDDTPGF